MQIERPTVLLIRSELLHWRGLCAALTDCAIVQMIADVQQPADALRIAQRDHPSLIIMPDRIDGLPIGHLVRDFHRLSPVSTFLVVGEELRLDYDALVVLASLPKAAYVLWDDLTEEALLLCLQLLLKTSLRVTSPKVVAALTQPQPSPVDLTSCLSEREREVFQLAGSGMTYEKIAANLYISASTVKTHAAHIRHKLELARHEDLGAAYRRLRGGSPFG
jgi:DNA-binding NarL/FixJ family response regulator